MTAPAPEPSAVQDRLDSALRHHVAGRHSEAESVYQAILAQDPNCAEALHMLGIVAFALGRHEEAIERMRRSLAMKPDCAAYHNNLGNVLARTRRVAEAVAAYQRALELQPTYVEAMANMAVALQQQGRIDEAVTNFRRSLELRPRHAPTLHNLALALRARNELDSAIAALREALAVQPNFSDALLSLGDIQVDQGLLQEAIETYRRVTALNPDSVPAHNSLGLAYRAAGAYADAIIEFRRALAIDPRSLEANNNLGVTFHENGQVDECIAAYRQSLALYPTSPDACCNLANALRDAGRLDEAMTEYRRALELRPDHNIATNMLFAMHSHPGYDRRRIFEEHAEWNRRFARPLRVHARPHDNNRDPERPLRVGYLSPDLSNHPVGRFLLPLLTAHSREAVHSFCYSATLRPDTITDRLRAQAGTWRSLLGLSDEQADDLIRRDGIDILVDLSLHTRRNRLLLFARKPAPVQVTWLGYSSTTGLETMDWRLTDPWLDPPGRNDDVYSEKTYRLPHTFWCYPYPTPTPDVGPTPARSTGTVTFGCLNGFPKIGPQVIALWCRLLREAPGTRLMLHCREGAHRRRLLDAVAGHGVDPARIALVGFLPMMSYFGQYRHIDIGLDPFPFAGGTTTCDALWMGVPIVSLAGETSVSRGGLSILSNIGLPELAVDSPDRYIETARALAADLPRLEHLRSTMRRRMTDSPLMDAPGFARDMEAAFRQMWRAWCASPK